MTTTRKDARTDVWADRVASGDWGAITEEVNEYGGALLPRLLTAEEAGEIRGLYDDQNGVFRTTVDMGRHRFGEGQYRYFNAPYPEPVDRLKQALYPRLLPIRAIGGASSAGRRFGPKHLTSGLRCVTRPARPSPRPSCSNTARGTGTRCTVTCTATWCSHCRLSSI